MFVSKARLNTHTFIHKLIHQWTYVYMNTGKILSKHPRDKTKCKIKKAEKIDISLWVRNTSNWINLYNIFLVADVQCKLNVFPCRGGVWICVLYNFHFFSFFLLLKIISPFIEYSWRGEKSKRFIHPNWIKEKWNKHWVHNKFLFYLYCLSKYLLDNLYQHISCFICRLLFVSPSSSNSTRKFMCEANEFLVRFSLPLFIYLLGLYCAEMNIIKLRKGA